MARILPKRDVVNSAAGGICTSSSFARYAAVASSPDKARGSYSISQMGLRIVPSETSVPLPAAAGSGLSQRAAVVSSLLRSR